MTILRTCPKQEAASSTCCSRAMDVIAQGLSRPARRMGDDAFSAARAGCHSAPLGFVLQRRVRPQFSPSCWYRPRACLFERWARLVPTQRVISARPMSAQSALASTNQKNLRVRLSRGRDASRRRWRSLALWLLCEPLLLCAPCATAA